MSSDIRDSISKSSIDELSKAKEYLFWGAMFCTGHNLFVLYTIRGRTKEIETRLSTQEQLSKNKTQKWNLPERLVVIVL